MCANPLSEEADPDVAAVFDALASDQCREVLRDLDRPMTAAEVAESCGRARSTVYRALERMVDAGLLRKHEGGDATRYSVDFEEVVLRADGGLEVSLTSPSRSVTDQLAELWGGGGGRDSR
ncbi:MAG: helix-turn-helix domain-containing protein [Haloquadratum sp.]